MKLILSHTDLELALIESLRAKGMTAFEPGKATVEFSFKRGTKELICELDTEGKPAAPEAPAAEPKPAAAEQKVATEAKLAEPAPETPAEPAAEAPAEAPAEHPAEQPAEAPASAPADEENLFG